MRTLQLMAAAAIVVAGAYLFHRDLETREENSVLRERLLQCLAVVLVKSE